MAERVLNKPKTIFAEDGTRIKEEPAVNEGFRLGILRTLVENHGKCEERRGEGTIGDVDGFLELAPGGIKLPEAIVGQAEIVVGAIRRGSELDGGGEEGQTGFGVTLLEEAGALFKCALGFGGHGEFLNGDNVIAWGSGRVVSGRRLRTSLEA